MTEAGDGEDGRIKSAVGIGSLLEDGIGDTIRVSLTEDPEREIPVARELVSVTSANRLPDGSAHAEVHEHDVSPYEFDRFPSAVLGCGPVRLGDGEVPRVQVRLDFDEWDAVGGQLSREVVSESGEPLPAADLVLFDLKTDDDAARYREIAGAWGADETACGAHLVPGLSDVSEISAVSHKVEASVEDDWDEDSLAVLLDAVIASGNCLQWNLPGGRQAEGWTGEGYARWKELHDRSVERGVTRLLVGICGPGLITGGRALAARMRRDGIRVPLHFITVTGEENDVRLSAAVQHGTLLCDGMGDSIEVSRPAGDAVARQRIAFNILQASGRRVVKTEYVACPSCGRTLFDLQDTTERIRSRTAHLKGVKIAIMGCIVNGPGEMADADFGYVGSSAGNVSLYVGKTCVERNIPEAEADDRLIRLIQDHGRWVEPVN